MNSSLWLWGKGFSGGVGVPSGVQEPILTRMSTVSSVKDSCAALGVSAGSLLLGADDWGSRQLDELSLFAARGGLLAAGELEEHVGSRRSSWARGGLSIAKNASELLGFASHASRAG